MDDILNHLVNFDRQRGWNTYETVQTDKERLELLYQHIVNLVGELGEFANEVKKSRRDNVWREEKLKEELTDTFIFLLKLAKTLKMDLREEYFKKMEQNEERFPPLQR